MSHIEQLIADVRRRWFATVALRTLGLAALAAAQPAIAAVLVDRLLAPGGLALVLLGAAAVGLSLAAALVVAFRTERRPNDRRVARFIEERAGELPGVGSLDDIVVSAVDASHAGPDRAAIAALIVAAAKRQLEGVEGSAIVPTIAIRRAALVAAAGVLTLYAVIWFGAPSLTRALETARLRWFPHSVTVEVLPGDTRVVAGRPVTIRAKVSAGDHDVNQFKPRLTVAAGSEQRTVDMSKGADGFEYTFEAVDRTFRYRVSAGATTSSDYTVTALFPPRVQRIDILYTYPSFSGLAPREEEDGGDIYAPAGTRVRLRIHTDKPVASGQLALGSGGVALRSAGERAADAELVLTKDDSYRVKLVDGDGLASDGDSEYFIRLMDDRPPDVRILRPAGDQGITPLEEVTIEARADDDYGVASLELVYSVAGGPEKVVPFSRLGGTAIQKTGAQLLAAEDLNVRPGDVITYYARARDVGRGKRPTVAQSEMFFLEVKPFTEEFVAAQSQASGGQSGDPQLDSLIAAQKEIISATWNIERRSQGGRSAEDIAAIAKAQAELKARAEQMAGSSRGRRGGREPFPPAFAEATAGVQPTPQQRPPSGEGVAAAIAAMTRAVEQLGAQKTRDAIPHEMAALNGLLQAAAEVRRRQVTQQASGSGSGGGNRSGQDLSALFDKELQRQQRTNYEQRSQVEERPDQRQGNDDALDRIKDLARRQEELNRRQRELAEKAAEERKRELEKLTREQNELRQQAEDLARQMGQQQSGMRDAAEQMRQASGEMRRENASGAQASGERAADQLRRLEQQMRGGNADARQRQTGEAQSEAQQIAQEQRRIAGESERLAKNDNNDPSGSGTADARRRLADEQERLAKRVEELRRASPEAAEEIDRQRLAERMRQSAQQARNGKPGEERQIAEAMDKVVEKLGGAATADARKLSEELDRTRQIRERLDRLEKQMQQAQGKQDGQLEKLQQQYAQELRRAQETLGRPGEGQQSGRSGETSGQGRGTPEQHEFSRSAPGTEAFKQDRSGWDSLRKDVNRALEQREAAISKRLATKMIEARFSAGGSDRVPEAYRESIAKYYESLARVKK